MRTRQGDDRPGCGATASGSAGLADRRRTGDRWCHRNDVEAKRRRPTAARRCGTVACGDGTDASYVRIQRMCVRRLWTPVSDFVVVIGLPVSHFVVDVAIVAVGHRRYAMTGRAVGAVCVEVVCKGMWLLGEGNIDLWSYRP